MTTLQRSAAICGSLLALPIAAVVVVRAGDDARPARPELRAVEPVPVQAPVIEKPAAIATARIVNPTPPSAPVAVRLPTTMPLPEQARDYAVGADQNREKAVFVGSDPAGIQRPVRHELKALSRVTEDPQAEEP